MFPSTFTAAILLLLWGAAFYFNWMAAALLLPLFAAGLLFAFLTPPFEPEKLATLKGASAALPGGARQAADLGGEAQPPWKYRAGRMGKWHPALVPGDLGVVFGISWKRRRHFYRREVELPETAAGKRVFVCFEGVGGEFRAAVDGAPAGPPAPAFLPVEFEITNLVQNKKRFELSVSVRDAHGPNSGLRPGRIGFAFAKGIYRGVRLELRPPAFISGAALSAGDPAHPELEITLDGSSEHPTTLSLSCLSADGGKRFEHSDVIPPFKGGKKVAFNFPEDAAPEWSPDNPRMHRLIVKTASGPARDEREFALGRSAVRWEADGAVIGGKKRKLIGISWMDFLPPYGASLPEWAVRRDVRTIKEAGFNFIWVDRLPPTEELLDACDREGLLVGGEWDVGRGRSPRRRGSAPCRAGSPHPAEKIPLPPVRDGVGALQFSLHPCLLFMAARGGPAPPVEVIRETVIPDPFDLRLPAFHPKTKKPVILHIEHFDGSLASDSRNVRDHRRAAFDLEFLNRMESLPVAGAVLGSLIYWGCRIGLLAETRRPTFSYQAISSFLNKGEAMPVKLEKPLPPPSFLIPALAAALLALAVPACKPFVEKLFAYPHAVLSFTHPWESLLLRLATAAAAAFAVSNRLHARPMRALDALAPLPLFLSRPMIRNRSVQLSAIFLFLLYVWFAGTCACSWITGKSFAATLPFTAQAGILDLLLLLLLLPGAPAAPAALGAGAAAFLYLLQMVPPAGAAAYGAVAMVTYAALMKRL